MATNTNTVPHVLHHWATHQPDTAAFIFKDSTMRRRILTRADVYRIAARFASILRHDGVRRGDVVCNTLPNSPERVVSDFGIMLAGAAAMNGQIFLADGADFIGSLLDSRAKAVILDPLQPKGAMSFLAPLGKEDLSDGTVHIQKLPALNRIFHCHWERQGEISSFMDMLEEHQDSYVADVTADDIACIWNTSGSTGFSKLIPHSHSSFLHLSLKFSSVYGVCHFNKHRENVDTGTATTERSNTTTSSQIGSRMEEMITNADTDDVDLSQHSLSKSPADDKSEDAEVETRYEATHFSKYVFFNNNRLGWSGGFPGGFLAAGATRILVDLSRGPPNDPVALIWTMICQEQCKFAFMLPYHAQQILSRDDLQRNMPWKLSMLSLAGQPIHASVVKNAMAIMTDSIIILYGSSELGEVTLKTVLDPDKYEDCNNGKPFPGIEVKIVDEKLKEIPSAMGKMGEIIVRPDIKLLGYINNEEATQKSILPGGWFRTGDVGYFNDEGDLFIICRTAFVIMRGAYLLYPGWLEARISTHPAVETVLVVPVPDPVLHQELCACVVTKSGASLTAEKLREFCQTLFLTDSSDHMTAVPPYFLFFSALPTTTTGKPCRHSTTKEARARLGL